MRALDDPSWTTLHWAHGDARGIPALLAQIDGAAEDDASIAPWYALSSALCDQGTVHSAAFAAVPHSVALVSEAPERESPSHFVPPASIVLARAAHDAEFRTI